MELRRHLDSLDAALIVVLLAATGLYAHTVLIWSLHPFEDAAILMRYAQHLAGGHGIVWNIGERPVDGATDFLFMAVVAGLARLGLSVEGAVRLVGLLSHFASVALVYGAVRRLHGASRWVAFFSAAYLAVGPGLRFVAAYFGTPFFVVFVCLAWWAAEVLARGGTGRATPALFAAAGLTMGLIRPEGVFLTGLMLAAVLYRRGLKASWHIVVWVVGVFAVIGGAYFVWRWSYFGHPLPNPYYKKGGGALHWGGLVWAVKTTVKSCLPFAAAYVAAFRSGRTTRQAAFSLIPIVGFVVLWLLLSPEGNYFGRFQYAVLPLVLMSWPALVAGLAADWRLPAPAGLETRSRAALTAVIVLAALAALGYHHRLSRMPIRAADGRYTVAMVLRDYRDKSYTLATTEAGLLPFYSQWRSIDAWGLNDPWIAHHGKVTEDYLARHEPQVIMFHAYFSPVATEGRDDAWNAMAMTLKRYAERRGYIHAAAFGESPFDTHHYYVRPDFPDSREITRRIRAASYTWMSSGRASVNFAVLRDIREP